MQQFFGFYMCFYSLVLISYLPVTVSSQSPADFIPWTWQVGHFTTDNGVCPSTASILATFAVINILVSILSLIVGNQKLIESVTCGYIDGDDDKVTWFYMFIFPLGINLGSNALIAYLYKSTPGFGENFTIADLTLFYTTRPRLSWLVLVIFMNIDALRKKEKRYIRSAKAAVAAEALLQILSSYYMGKTVHFAAKNGYYRHIGAAPQDARVMYAAALLSLVSLFFTLISLVFILNRSHQKTTFPVLVIIGCTSWLGSWMFWGGFVSLAGPL